MEMKEQVTLLHTHLIHNRFQVFIQGKLKKKRKKAVFNQQYFIYYYQENIYYHTHIFKIII